MYLNGFFHSSSVGRYIGASSRPCGRLFFLIGSRQAVGWPRRSTDERLRGALVLALKGVWEFVGWKPLTCVALAFAVEAGFVESPPAGEPREPALTLALNVVLPAPAKPPADGTDTIFLDENGAGRGLR